MTLASALQSLVVPPSRYKKPASLRRVKNIVSHFKTSASLLFEENVHFFIEPTRLVINAASGGNDIFQWPLSL